MVLEAEKSKIKVLSDLVPGEGSPPGRADGCLLAVPLKEEGGGSGLSSSS